MKNLARIESSREGRETNVCANSASKSGSGAWTRTRITSSKGWRATNCTTPELLNLESLLIFAECRYRNFDCRESPRPPISGQRVVVAHENPSHAKCADV